MSACCCAGRKTSGPMRKVKSILAWLLPSAVLVLMPKCPACVAAYVVLWTGLGVSLTAAVWLRWGLLFLCAGSLLFLIVKRIHFKKEIESCNTK